MKTKFLLTKKFLLLCLFICALQSRAQVGIGTTSPDNSAKLDITASDKGILIPRVTLTDVTNIVTPINAPAEGLMIYNTNNFVTGGNGVGFYFFNGTSWKKITSVDDNSINLKDIGVISAFPGANYPNDMYLPLSGGTYNDVDYPEFAAFIPSLDSDVVTNNNNGTFTLTNWNNNGTFLRGIGGNASNIGALQIGATKMPNSIFRTSPRTISTNTGGSHNHRFFTAINDVNNSNSQGYPASNNHLAFRTTNRRQVLADNGTISANGSNHIHSINIPSLPIIGGDIETRPINRSITWVIKVKPSASSVSNLTINNFTDIGTDDQKIDVFSFNSTSNVLYISNENDGEVSKTVNLSSLNNSGTDDQKIDLFNFNTTSNILSISNENDGVVNRTVNLSSLNNSGTDNQRVDIFNFNTVSNILSISNENDGVPNRTVDLSSINGDITQINAGNGLTGGGISGNITLNAIGSNGLTTGANDIKLGGNLTQFTGINLANNNMAINLSGTGSFSINNTGGTFDNGLRIGSNGENYIIGNVDFKSINSGSNFASITDNAQNGKLKLFKSGSSQHQIDANGNTYFNFTNSDLDFQIGSLSTSYMFYIDAGNNRVGLGTQAPTNTLHVVGSARITDLASVTINKQIIQSNNNGVLSKIADGGANHVLKTDGNGNYSFVDANSIVTTDVEWVDDMNVPNTLAPRDGDDTSLRLGSSTGLAQLRIESTSIAPFSVESFISGTDNVTNASNIFLNTATSTGEKINQNNLQYSNANGLQTVMLNDFNNSSTFDRKAIKNIFTGSTDSNQVGMHNDFDVFGVSAINGQLTGIKNDFGTAASTHNGSQIGVDNSFNGTGDSTQYGIINSMSNNGNGDQFGVQNIMRSTGDGDLYGFYVDISGSGSGNKYGIFSDTFSAANAWAGMFLGKVSIGTTLANAYTLPPSAGTNGQIMQIDNAGQLSFVDHVEIGDISSVTAGNGLIGGGTTGAVTLNVVATNGLTTNANNIKLGGILTEDTSLNSNGFNIINNLSGVGHYFINTSGLVRFRVTDSGRIEMPNIVTEATGSQNTGILEIGNSLRLDRDEIITNTGTTLRLQQNNNGDLGVDTNTLYVDASLNKVGVGTTTPDEKFSVAGIANLNEGVASGVALKVNGDEALSYNGTYFSWGFGGTANYFSDKIGIGSGNTTPDTRLHLKHINNNNVAGFKIENTSNTYSNSWRMYVNSSISGDLNFYSSVIGGITVTTKFDGTTGAVFSVSDKRLKKDFIDLHFNWNDFMTIKPLSYRFKNQKGNKKSIGFIAQDIQKIYPELVSYTKDEDIYHMNYSGFGTIAIKAVQELKKEVDLLKKENIILKEKLSRIELLEERLKKLER
jgi:hypothetical protein